MTGRVEITGPLPRVKCVVTGLIKGFQAHPSLTGGKALPAEDGSFRAETILHLTADNKPDRLDIPLLEAKSSFLDAKVSNGRLASLRSELREPPSAPPSPLRDRPSGRRPWPR